MSYLKKTMNSHNREIVYDLLKWSEDAILDDDPSAIVAMVQDMIDSLTHNPPQENSKEETVYHATILCPVQVRELVKDKRYDIYRARHVSSLLRQSFRMWCIWKAERFYMKIVLMVIRVLKKCF